MSETSRERTGTAGLDGSDSAGSVFFFFPEPLGGLTINMNVSLRGYRGTYIVTVVVEVELSLRSRASLASAGN